MFNWIKRLFKKKPDLKIIKKEVAPAGTVLAPPWFIVAYKEIGVKEVINGESERILEYHQSTTLRAKQDEVPWCAAFACWCFEKCGYISPKSAWARSFLNWGLKLDIPRYGCVCVFKRGDNGGHVGFYVSEYPGHILVLGGNQKNSVCVSPYKKSDLLGYRWPSAQYDIPYSV